MAEWLPAQHHVSNWKARRMIDAAHALEHLPRTAAALESGALSLDKVVELVRFATPGTEEKLIAWARRVTVAGIRKRTDEESRRSLDDVVEAHESRHLRWWWEPSGDRLWFEGMVPADQGAVLTNAIDGIARRLPKAPDDHGPGSALGPEDSRDRRRADALVLLASGGNGDRAEAAPATVVLHAPLEALADGHGNCSIENGPVLHPETARRLACDARLQIVLCGKHGDPLGVGRAARIAPRWLRRQVLRRDGHTCTFPGCEMKRFLVIHHIRFWGRKGPTEMWNLITVCPFHHTLVHEQG